MKEKRQYFIDGLLKSEKSDDEKIPIYQDLMQYTTLRNIMINKFKIKYDSIDTEIDDVENKYEINADYQYIARRALEK